jgi:glycolate oxidase FAD binding subunit
MPEPLAPATEAELADIVRAAAAERAPLAVVGGGTRQKLGRPVQAERALSTRNLAGITLYEPAELVLSARAGTPLAEVEAALAARGQRLPFEPMDHRPLLGSTGEPSIGGLVAANVSGPRRVHAGALRDSLIGVRMVTGRGEAITSGGRVMKNVTGYDLVKLSAGAFGTLGVLTEVTFKVLPRARGETTLVLDGLDDFRGIEALSAGLGSPFEVTGAAHLPADGRGPAWTLLRLEGTAEQVDYRADALARRLARFGTARRLDADSGGPLWTGVRNGTALTERREQAVWRISTAPSRGPAVIAALGGVVLERLYDWGGGLVWIATDATGDAGAAAIRAVLKREGGHATLVRAPEPLRAVVDVFEPLPPPLMALTRGIKAAFDPAGVLNPGRMYAGV